MAYGPLASDDLAVMAGNAFFARCLTRLEDDIRFEDVTGVSFRELIVPCLIIPATDAFTNMELLFSQFRVLHLIILREEDPLILETIHRERVISYTSSIVKRAPRGPGSRYRRRIDVDPEAPADWLDALVVMWREIFCFGAISPSLPSPSETITGKLATEAVESRTIFLVEYWSISALDNQLSEYSIRL